MRARRCHSTQEHFCMYILMASLQHARVIPSAVLRKICLTFRPSLSQLRFLPRASVPFLSSYIKEAKYKCNHDATSGLYCPRNPCPAAALARRCATTFLDYTHFPQSCGLLLQLIVNSNTVAAALRSAQNQMSIWFEIEMWTCSLGVVGLPMKALLHVHPPTMV